MKSVRRAYAAALLWTMPLWAQTPAPVATPQVNQTAGAAQAEERDTERRLRAQLADWAALGRYRSEDAALPAPVAGEQRVVFFGDSITDAWGRRPGTGSFFPGKPYVNRGISGQTTPQMLVRFQQDVIHLHPAAVVILAGTNDIAGNTGPSTPEMIEDNFSSMASIARQSGIRVVFASITPAFAYPWKPEVHPVPEIREVNNWLRKFCAIEGYVYLDYYSEMSDDQGAMLAGYSSDGVHPTEKGYGVMAPLAERAITLALKK